MPFSTGHIKSKDKEEISMALYFFLCNETDPSINFGDRETSFVILSFFIMYGWGDDNNDPRFMM
jgi:hypothetical protein